MGTPTFYGTEIAMRCLRLLDGLEGYAAKIEAPNAELGSLRPTFLLSMAYPMIIQPYERFMTGKGTQYDLQLHEVELSKLFGAQFKEKKGLSWLLEGNAEKWSWARIERASVEGRKEFPFEQGGHFLDTQLREHLAAPKSHKQAANELAKTLIEVLRHSLAHGSILYLDDSGDVAHGQPVGKFLFCNERRGGEQNYIQAYEFLEVSVEGFAGFLRSWAVWLESLERMVRKVSASS